MDYSGWVGSYHTIWFRPDPENYKILIWFFGLSQAGNLNRHSFFTKTKAHYIFWFWSNSSRNCLKIGLELVLSTFDSDKTIFDSSIQRFRYFDIRLEVGTRMPCGIWHIKWVGYRFIFGFGTVYKPKTPSILKPSYLKVKF